MENIAHRQHHTIAFGDTDASSWLHFPNIFRFIEATEHDFLKSRDVIVFDRALGGWPRVHVQCDYHAPLVAGDEIEVILSLGKIGTTSLTWNFQVVRLPEQLAASGQIVTVRVDATGKTQAISEKERTALTRSNI